MEAPDETRLLVVFFDDVDAEEESLLHALNSVANQWDSMFL